MFITLSLCIRSHAHCLLSLHSDSATVTVRVAQAFHLMSGLDGFSKYCMRKAIRKWISRASVRKGLRRMVFMTAQRGRDLMLLLRMMDDADTDDLSNAILAKDAEGSTPLLHAAKKGNLDVVEAFLSSGGRCAEELQDEALLQQIVDSTDGDGNTALHWAARKNFDDVAAALLEAGANVNARNKEFSTPLHWAARKDNETLVTQLVGAGARLDLVNKWGATALEQAKAFEQTVAVRILQEEEKRRKASATKQGGSNGKKPAGDEEQQARAWGQGPGGDHLAQPVVMREMQAKRRVEAEKRRQGALKARDKLDDEKAKDQAVRRKRQALEIKLKELIDSAQGPMTAQQARSQQARPGARSPMRSPPKKSVTDALSEVLNAAAEVECAPALIELGRLRLREVEELRTEIKKARRAEQKAREAMKDPDAEMAKMERKLQKKMGRR
jgi:hypothetical protein